MDFRHRRTRRRSFDVPFEPHELTFSIYKRYQFLRADRFCYWMKDSLENAREKHGFQIWAYVFMFDHVHLILCPNGESKIASILKSIKEPISKRALKFLESEQPNRLPKLTRKRGKRTERLIWQSGGGFDRNILEPKTLGSMIRYVHLNPVRKGYVEKAEDWNWSSARWYISNGKVSPPISLDPIPEEWATHVEG